MVNASAASEQATTRRPAVCANSTSGDSVWANAQPTFRSTVQVSLALGHNGNLINTRELTGLLDGPGQGNAGIVATSRLFVQEDRFDEVVKEYQLKPPKGSCSMAPAGH